MYKFIFVSLALEAGKYVANLLDGAQQTKTHVVSDPVSTVRSTVTSTAEGVSGGREKRRERFLSSS